MGLPEGIENAYLVIPIALNYYATKLEGIQKSVDKEENEYGFARQVQTALSEDLTLLIDEMRKIAKEIKTKNDSKNDDWEKVPLIIENHKGIVTLSLVKMRDDLLKAQNLTVDAKLVETGRMPNVKKLLDSVEQTKKVFGINSSTT